MDDATFNRLREIYPNLTNNLEFINSFTLLWNIFESELSNLNFDSNYRGFKAFIGSGNLSNFECSSFIEFWRTKGDYDFLNQRLLIDHRIRNQAHLTRIKGVLNSNNNPVDDNDDPTDDSDDSVNDKNFSSLCICYRIRNNLFHGRKNILILENQREIFTITNNCLLDLIEYLNSNRTTLNPYSIIY